MRALELRATLHPKPWVSAVGGGKGFRDLGHVGSSLELWGFWVCFGMFEPVGCRGFRVLCLLRHVGFRVEA